MTDPRLTDEEVARFANALSWEHNSKALRALGSEVQERRAAERPIPVSERLPGQEAVGPFSRYVLAFNGIWQLAYYEYDRSGWSISGVTYWRDLPPDPEAPEEVHL